MKPTPFGIVLLAFLFTAQFIFAQTSRKDKGHFIEYQNAFWEEIKESLDKDYQRDEPDTIFALDVSGYTLPESVDQFTRHWHNPPVAQGRTGTCWSFSTTSFLESEVYRQTGREVKLSEMFTVYWEYVEKARRFIRERGDSRFTQGSEANAVTRMWKQYGTVPLSAYPGKPADQPHHDHDRMYEEMSQYLNSLGESNAWNESLALETIRSILDHYMGAPPEEFTLDGTTYTPMEYLNEYLQINPDDYVEILSLKELPYYEQVEYPVPDNWWHSDVYYNIPLSEFTTVLNRAVQEGFTVSIGGDVSEAGYLPHEDVAMIPTFDIPPEHINEDARQFRFDNRTTTDDHGIHLVGHLTSEGEDWYLIKDSGSGSRNGANRGYYFYHEDYIKLKMMDFTIHRDAVEDILNKF